MSSQTVSSSSQAFFPPTVSDRSAESHLLQAAIRASLDPSGTGREFPALLAAVDWDRLLWLGRQEGALLFLRETLAHSPDRARCPDTVLGQLDTFWEVNQLRVLSRIRELCLLQAAFDRAGIAALPIEGLPPDPAAAFSRIEPSRALRYLVPTGLLDRALAVVREAGHPTETGSQRLFRIDRSPVLLASSFAAATDSTRLWSDAVAIDIGGRRLLSLSPLHQLLQRAARRDPGIRIRLGDAWELVQLARRLGPSDWDRAAREAAALGLPATWDRVAAAVFDRLAWPRPSRLAAVETGPEPAVTPPPADVDRVPFLPTTPSVARRMLVLAGTGPDDVVCDLGCGDGRLGVLAAKEFGARSVGVDLDPARVAEATAHAVRAGVATRATFVRGDLFAQDLSAATVLCLYLLPGFFPRLRDKLAREARPGLRIVSHDYVFPDWPPERTEILRPHRFKISQIYLWRL